MELFRRPDCGRSAGAGGGYGDGGLESELAFRLGTLSVLYKDKEKVLWPIKSKVLSCVRPEQRRAARQRSKRKSSRQPIRRAPSSLVRTF